MRSFQLIAPFSLFVTLSLLGGCGDGAFDYNQALVKLGDRPKADMAELSSLLQTYDGSETKKKAIDSAYAKLLESIKEVKADHAKLAVPTDVEQGQEIHDAFKLYLASVEAMLTTEWAEAIKLIQLASTQQGAALADTQSKLRLIATKLQTKSKATDMAIQDAQATFVKANNLRMAN